MIIKRLNMNIDITTLYSCATELNYDIASTKQSIPRYNKQYDYQKIENYPIERHEMIDLTIQNCGECYDYLG